MAGCDYLASLPGIGLGKSYKFWGKVTQPSLKLALPKIPGYLNMNKIKVDEEYVQGFIKGFRIFIQYIRTKCKFVKLPL
jgi:exonuclease-1